MHCFSYCVALKVKMAELRIKQHQAPQTLATKHKHTPSIIHHSSYHMNLMFPTCTQDWSPTPPVVFKNTHRHIVSGLWLYSLPELRKGSFYSKCKLLICLQFICLTFLSQFRYGKHHLRPHISLSFNMR